MISSPSLMMVQRSDQISSWARRSKRRQRGQGMTEFVVIGGIFLMLMSGVIEMSYIFRAKHTLNSATFDAVRAGTLHNALLAPMSSALARSMAPLFMKGGTNDTALTQAVSDANQFLTDMSAFGVPITIISPTKEVFDKLKIEQPVQLTTDATVIKQYVLPNDNLEWRSRTTQAITANGQPATINLQDANLLKIEAYWCQRLIVPGLDMLFHAALPTSTPQTMCDNLTASTGYYYIVIEASAIARMQTPVTDNNNLN